jgi:hypothetical protein
VSAQPARWMSASCCHGFAGAIPPKSGQDERGIRRATKGRPHPYDCTCATAVESSLRRRTDRSEARHEEEHESSCREARKLGHTEACSMHRCSRMAGMAAFDGVLQPAINAREVSSKARTTLACGLVLVFRAPQRIAHCRGTSCVRPAWRSGDCLSPVSPAAAVGEPM